MAKKIFAGVSAFFANRPGNHSWLENDKRPIINVVTTDRDGNRTYDDLFLNTEVCKVTVRGNRVTIGFDKAVNKPLFRVLERD